MALKDAWGVDGKTYDGAEMRLLVASLTQGRGGVTTPADLKATPSGSPDNKVAIAAGTGVIPATSGGTLGSFEVPNDAALASPAFGATGASPRWDLLLLQVVAGVPQLTVVAGTPSGSPSYPSLAGQNDYIVLCGVKMPASTSIIDNGSNGTIDDRRSLWMVHVVCTSTTRPPIPFDGQVIYETDTDKRYVWDGTSWVDQRSPSVVTSGTRPTGNDRYEGRHIYESDTDKELQWDGTQWVTVFERDWTAYTPNVRNSGQANVTRTVTYAKYRRSGKQINVEFHLDITSGSGGAGDIQVDLPVSAAQLGVVAGTMTMFDLSGNIGYIGAAVLVTGAPHRVYMTRDSAAGAIGHGTQLASGDYVKASFVYEAAAF